MAVDRIRMQYLGLLSLVGEMSAHLRSGLDSEELRASVENAMMDAEPEIPGFRWRRTLNRFDIDIDKQEG